MKHSFSPTVSAVGYLTFKCEPAKLCQSVETKAPGKHENYLVSITESLCSELILIFRVYIIHMFYFCTLFNLLSLSFLLSPPGLWLQNNKVRRFAFELKMQDKSTYLLASDSEGEMEDWINTLNKILHSSFEIAMQEKRNGDIHDGVYFSSA